MRTTTKKTKDDDDTKALKKEFAQVMRSIFGQTALPVSKTAPLAQPSLIKYGSLGVSIGYDGDNEFHNKANHDDDEDDIFLDTTAVAASSSVPIVNDDCESHKSATAGDDCDNIRFPDDNMYPSFKHRFASNAVCFGCDNPISSSSTHTSNDDIDKSVLLKFGAAITVWHKECFKKMQTETIIDRHNSSQ